MLGFAQNAHVAPAGNEIATAAELGDRSAPNIGRFEEGMDESYALVANESAHQVDACRILKHFEGDATRAKQLLLADKRLVLPGDDLRDAVQQDGAAAHGTR